MVNIPWFIGLFLLTINFAIGEDSIFYNSIELKPMPASVGDRFERAAGSLGLSKAFVGGQGSSYLGVNLVFSDSFLNSRIIIKYGVKGNYKLGKTYELDDYRAVHVALDDTHVGIYYKNFSKSNINELIKLIDREKHYSGLSFSLISNAHADSCVKTNLLPTPGNLEDISAISVSSMMADCFSNAKEGGLDSTVGVAKSIYKSLNEEKDRLFNSPIKRLKEYVSFVGDGLDVLWDFSKTMGQLVTNPSSAIATLKHKYGEFGEQIGQFYSSIEALGLEQKMEAICLLIGSLGVDVLITVLTGGAAGAKIG
ncbi:MAG: hypothetical protein KC478_09480, partial [Bacteriovoracaceae bacterium]|nr:hypothetical protein [Bacteriovoracaceae bacterium]